MLDIRARRPAFLLPAMALAVALLGLLSHEMSPDGWYALLGGDLIVHHGLPSHDWLTVWGHGRRWVDQQWLAQLAFYGLYAFGGLRLALLVNALVVVASFSGALVAARARGAGESALLLVAIPAAAAVGLSSYALRPQTLALPLFVALLSLLVDDSRRPSLRVFLVLPLLVVWANIHGSVTLGVLLVLLAVACASWRERKVRPRNAGLAVASIAAALASPYGVHLLGYYHAILFNGQFAQYVPDWMPTTLGPTTLAFYVLAFLTLFAIGRHPTSLTLFERVTLVLLLLLSIQAIRGITWFSFASVIIVPSALRPVWTVAACAAAPAFAAAAVALLGTAAVALIQPGHRFESGYPASIAAATRAAAGSNAKVFANGAYSDWLLLREPALRGRVAYDARFEVLPRGRLADASSVSIDRWDTSRILAPFDVVVLRPEETELRAALLRTGRWQAVASRADVAVLRRARA